MGAIGGARFRLLTGRANAERLAGRVQLARETLDILAAHLAERPFLLGDGPTIADIAVFAYGSRAGDIGLPLASWPAVAAWAEPRPRAARFHRRLRALPAQRATRREPFDLRLVTPVWA